MARYSNPVTDTGHGSFTGHFEMSDSPKASMSKFTQPHGVGNDCRHVMQGDHTHMNAVQAVRAQAMQTYSAPARKPGTQATLVLGAPMRNVKAIANMDDTMITQKQAITRNTGLDKFDSDSDRD